MTSKATEIREAYDIIRDHNRNRYVRITEIQAMTGLTAGDLATEIAALMADTSFTAEPQPFGHRITADDRRYQVMIGGEARHLICWSE